MRMFSKVSQVLFLICIFSSQAFCQQPTLYGPSPYLSHDDSPFVQSAVQNLLIYDFENDSPEMEGAVAIHRNPNYETAVLPPGNFTDSVDSDDGAIDGLGQNGHSLTFGNNSGIEAEGFDIIFSKVAGMYPTHVGFVWTEGSNIPSPKIVTFYDASDNQIGEIGPVVIGDGGFEGGTEEDRFFGASYADGISRIFFQSPGSPTAVEIDHVQFNFNRILLGDINQDGVVSLLDVNPFVNLLTSGEFQAEADINQDGVVSLLDVAPFVQILVGN